MEQWLVDKIGSYLLGAPQVRFRDERATYISSMMSDSRDQYWQRTGVAPTNPPDLMAQVKMGIGKGVEMWLKQYVLNNLHLFGAHSILSGGQVSVGFTAPVAVDGYVDDLMVLRDGAVFLQPFVVEVKTKSGFGADIFTKGGYGSQPYEVGYRYLSQMGAYLHDLHAKKGIKQGSFLFVPLSDKSIGTIVEIRAEYEPSTGIVRTVAAKDLLTGATAPCNERFDMNIAFNRVANVERCIQEGKLPEADYVYKHKLTPEYLANVTDTSLEKAMKGEKILGDWEIAYSSYKDKHIELSGGRADYSVAELALLAEEWFKRHPRSKKYLDLRRAA